MSWQASLFRRRGRLIEDRLNHIAAARALDSGGSLSEPLIRLSARGAHEHGRPRAHRPDKGLTVKPDPALVLAARNVGGFSRDYLFEHHLHGTRRFAKRLLGADQELNDVVQDCMLHALEAFERLRKPEFFTSWLGGVTMNTVRSTLRRRRRQALAGLLSAGESPAWDALPSAAMPPDMGAELAAILQRLDALPERHRAAWMLWFVDGYTLEEVAQRLACSTISVRRWVTRAQDFLARRGKQTRPRSTPSRR